MVNMNDKELEKLLKGAGAIPECPTDKFVASFLAQMDDDLVQKPIVKSRVPFYAAIAACLALAFGGLMLNQMGLFDNNSQITSDEFTEISSELDPEDQFASQLVGYEDISTIVPMEEL